MITKIQKWGNSLGVRIPKALARDLNVEEESHVDLRVENDCLVVTPVDGKSYDLAELLGQVTAENLHHEIDLGPAVGREVW